MAIASRRTRTARTALTGAAALALILLGIAIYVLVEGDAGEEFVDIRSLVGVAIRRFGVWASFALLYVEESGIPLPVPGDVYVTYLGHKAAGSWLKLLGSWVAVIAVVTAGSTNLYVLSRRYGHRLVLHPWARALHVDERQVARAERAFRRWGIWAVIFGRHIPGFRVPLTVVAGILEFPYRLFVPSVMVSTAIWAAVFLLLGETIGRQAARFLAGHAWAYAAGTVLVIVLAAVFVGRALRHARTEPGIKEA